MNEADAPGVHAVAVRDGVAVGVFCVVDSKSNPPRTEVGLDIVHHLLLSAAMCLVSAYLGLLLLRAERAVSA